MEFIRSKPDLTYRCEPENAGNESKNNSKDRDNDFAALFARRVMEPVVIFFCGLIVAIIGISLDGAGYAIAGVVAVIVGVLGTLIGCWLWALWII